MWHQLGLAVEGMPSVCATSKGTGQSGKTPHLMYGPKGGAMLSIALGTILCTDHSRVRLVAEPNCIFSRALGRLRRHPEESFP